MAEYVYAVFSNPSSPEDEDAFNDWYDRIHLNDALNVPGFKTAQRYKMPGELAEDAMWRYLTIYTIESDDVAATMAELMSRVGTDVMVIPPTIDRDNAYSAVFAPWGPLVTAD